MILDTHALVWWLTDDRRLPKRARLEIQNAGEALASAVSAYEIATKHRVGKMNLGRWNPADLPSLLERARIDVLAVTMPHALQAGQLGGLHKDPFDRLLIAQSQIEGLPIVSGDPVFEEYGVEVIW